MENKLIPMTDFVLQEFKKWENKATPAYQSTAKYVFNTKIYAQFLKQPLALWMFVPCDENNVPLEEPIYSITNYGASPEAFKRFEEDRVKFQHAKSRVLFEGFYYQSNYSEKTQTKYEYVRNKHPHVFSFEQINRNTIESLLTGFKEEFQITLTETALKQIYGS